jgi:hypothetical protein
MMATQRVGRRSAQLQVGKKSKEATGKKGDELHEVQYYQCDQDRTPIFMYYTTTL